MKSSYCQCGTRVHFENTFCQNCKKELGFLPEEGVLSALLTAGNKRWQSTVNNRTYRKCQNYAQHNACNWMVAETDTNSFCVSCRLSEIIPDLSNPENVKRWHRIERAKRRLLYSLFSLGLPVIDKAVDAERGLSFRLMEDRTHFSEFVNILPERDRVMTGHFDGVITLNIEEADPVLREEMRARMQERYRTLLGHLRHESGHYYWDRLLSDSPAIAEFRSLFGDERADYETTLKNYYNNGPVNDWQTNWISAYASAHPWEDWAECWAHYLHMVDTLETAYDFGFDVNGASNATYGQRFDRSYLASISINNLVDEWINLYVALNEMNRSMGLADAYPFVLSPTIVNKLSFIHKIITGA